MRWDDLFDDLEGQLERELTAEEVDLRAEEERLRLARLGLRDRLISVHSAPLKNEHTVLRLILRDGTRISVTPSTFGRDWFTGEIMGEGTRATSCVVPLDGIASISFTREQVAVSLAEATVAEGDRSLSTRLGLGFVLRDLCRRRSALEMRVDNETLHGTLDRVGRDHCDLAVHDAGGVRRESAVSEFRLVRFTQLLLVRL